jgi:predicted CXXCH cytochrome family protein
VLVSPSIPGAKYVGSEACASCHEEIVRDFKTATHARLQAKGKNAEAAGAGCESCHGPGSLHVDAGGGKNNTAVKIVNPGKSPQACFQCHLDKRADFSLPHSHPVLSGKMSCVDCHDPHKGKAVPAGSTSLHGKNQTCFKCHTAQKGPFIFEHEALREGCTVCHSPHGSVNAKMLTERNANLCLKCHFQQQSTGGQMMIGGQNHATRMARGTCWSAGCHEAVHGSQFSGPKRY